VLHHIQYQIRRLCRHNCLVPHMPLLLRYRPYQGQRSPHLCFRHSHYQDRHRVLLSVFPVYRYLPRHHQRTSSDQLKRIHLYHSLLKPAYSLHLLNRHSHHLFRYRYFPVNLLEHIHNQDHFCPSSCHSRCLFCRHRFPEHLD
jgi:hypothetical protein